MSILWRQKHTHAGGREEQGRTGVPTVGGLQQAAQTGSMVHPSQASTTRPHRYHNATSGWGLGRVSHLRGVSAVAIGITGCAAPACEAAEALAEALERVADRLARALHRLRLHHLQAVAAATTAAATRRSKQQGRRASAECARHSTQFTGCHPRTRAVQCSTGIPTHAGRKPSWWWRTRRSRHGPTPPTCAWPPPTRAARRPRRWPAR